MKTFNLTVTQDVQIEADLSKFTPEFIRQFKESFYHLETPEEHLNNIAEQFVKGHVQSPSCFLEGYGVLSEMGITKLRFLGFAEVS